MKDDCRHVFCRLEVHHCTLFHPHGHTGITYRRVYECNSEPTTNRRLKYCPMLRESLRNWKQFSLHSRVLLLSETLGGITFQHPFVCWTHTFLAAEYKGKDFLQIELNSYWLSLRLSDFYGTRNVITMFAGTDSMWFGKSSLDSSTPFLLLAIVDIT
jgi:hypothetical protein